MLYIKKIKIHKKKKKKIQALQLLEYLIKNGSERVVSNCHENIYTIRALQKFIYVDPNGKDQGINGIYNIFYNYIKKKNIFIK